MKRVLTILAIFLGATVICNINAQNAEYYTVGNDYGLNTSVITSTSGHGTNYSFSFSASNANKMFEVGVIYGKESKRIKGGEFSYKLFVAKNNGFLNELNIKPFVNYNMIYQNEIVQGASKLNVNARLIEIENTGKKGRVASIEHYLNTGVKVGLFNKLHLTASAGIGAYIGSLTDTERIGGSIKEKNSGFSTTAKVGFGYTF